MLVKLHPEAPDIALKLEERLNNIENIEDCVLVIQLSYREANTLFYLEKIDYINFEEYFIEIVQMNNNVCFLDYTQILEYAILNADDLMDLGVDYV